MIGGVLAALVLRSCGLMMLEVEVMSFAVVFVWCRVFKYLQLDPSIGILVIMVAR